MVDKKVWQATMKTRTPASRMPRPMLCCRQGRSYHQHDVAIRVQARKSVITTHMHFVANSDMQLNSYKALPAQNSFRKCRSRTAIVCIEPLSCSRPFAPNVLTEYWWRMIAKSGRVELGVFQKCAATTIFPAVRCTLPRMCQPFGSSSRTSSGFCWGFSCSMAFNNWLLLWCFFFKYFGASCDIYIQTG